MKNLRSSLPAKVAALFLSFFLICVCMASGVGVFVCFEGGYYQQSGMTMKFQDTEQFRILADNAAFDVLSDYIWNENGRSPGIADAMEGSLTASVARSDDPGTILYQVGTGAAGRDPIWTGTTRVYRDTMSGSDIPAGVQLKLGQEYLVTLVFYAIPEFGGFPLWNRVFQFLYPLHLILPVVAPLSLLLALICLVFLCCAAGRRKGTEEIVLNLQDHIPLDLYLAIIAALVMLAVMLFNIFLDEIGNSIIAGVVLFCFLVVLALATMMTLAARLKKGGWWKNTILYRLGTLLCRALRCLGRGVRKFFQVLPYTWRTALFVGGILFAQGLIVLSMFLFSPSAIFVLMFLDLLVLIGAVFFAWQMRQLFQEGAALAAGDLDAKVDTHRMFRALAAHGQNLNAIGDGMNTAVEQRMRSERFKTELITNVSHDLKTPLTSIINYVDLLKKEDIQNPAAREYISVLDRKSQRLKKLTEDLVEASKASTGVLTVERASINLNQLLEQALAEYEERFLSLDLHPMLLLPAPPVYIMADGRHLWRVLDNLLSNCCKYALSGTRVYLEAARNSGQAAITVKNISRDPLNISAEELMERFVRGDISRSTEGSGLGLSIARSLTEIQGGQFSLSIDGDLFKATILFPEEKAPADQRDPD